MLNNLARLECLSVAALLVMAISLSGCEQPPPSPKVPLSTPPIKWKLDGRSIRNLAVLSETDNGNSSNTIFAIGNEPCAADDARCPMGVRAKIWAYRDSIGKTTPEFLWDFSQNATIESVSSEYVCSTKQICKKVVVSFFDEPISSPVEPGVRVKGEGIDFQLPLFVAARKGELLEIMAREKDKSNWGIIQTVWRYQETYLLALNHDGTVLGRGQAPGPDVVDAWDASMAVTPMYVYYISGKMLYKYPTIVGSEEMNPVGGEGFDLTEKAQCAPPIKYPTIGPDGKLYLGCYPPQGKGIRMLRRIDVASNDQSEWKIEFQYNLDYELISSFAFDNQGNLFFRAGHGAIYSLDPEGPVLRWMHDASINNQYAQPVVTQDQGILFGGFDGIRKRDFLYKLNPETGWDFSGWIKPEYRGGIFVTPVITSNGNIYTGYGDVLWAVNAKGQQLWSRHFNNAIVSSPVIAPDGALYFLAGATLHAIQTDSKGPAQSPWPMYRHDPGHTNSTFSWNIIYPLLFDRVSYLDLMRNYRRLMLESDKEAASKYVSLLYQNGPFLIAVLQANPELRSRVKALILDNVDAVEGILAGKGGRLHDIDAITGFLNDLAMKSPPSLNKLLGMVNEDMQEKRRAGKKFLGFTLE